MLKKAQIQFTPQQIDQFDEHQRKTSATHNGLFHRAVDDYMRGIREHGVQKALRAIETSDTREAP